MRTSFPLGSGETQKGSTRKSAAFQPCSTSGHGSVQQRFFFSAAGQMGYGVELLLAVCGKDNTFRCRVIIYGLQHELHAIRIATLPGLLHSHPKISNYTLAKTAVTVMMSLLISAKISPFILRISCLQM